ncbi:MAG: excinuclease ABC subunit UvrB [Candidatus Omnitrophota bacterium]
MERFELVTDMTPQGDQPQAIEKLTEGIRSRKRFQTLLGVTGSGKTFTIAHVIANVNQPALVISHNKTLAAQLYSEFKVLFPKNAVEYFVSYYDYYQPEAYVPQTDTYIEKDASINDHIDRLRLSATTSLLSRRDVIIVASVSCIYGLGSPEDYKELLVFIERGRSLYRDHLLRQLVDIRYERNDYDFKRGKFRVKGDVVEIFPAYEESAVRVEFFGDEIEKIREINPLTGETITERERVAIYPAKHFVTTEPKITQALRTIGEELEERLKELRAQNKLLEAQRLESRTHFDMEMLQELGYCTGIENYSRHLSGRVSGSRPSCLLDYFPEGFLTIIDESHVTIPQIAGMYHGDRARKETLVAYGFRLPSALDNRPLNFEEFEGMTQQTVFVSATPSDEELEKSGEPVEQIIRPTGLVDPEIIVKPTQGQIEDLIGEIRKRAEGGERVLVTTLTKRLAEDLAAFLAEMRIRVQYLHSEIDAIQRVEILRDLRLRKFDCLVGINLLREGLDLPEVSLVAILDADKEGFLRSQTSLIQVSGRAARHINGQVIMYADTLTGSMKRAISETNRRRKLQLEYNQTHGITPRSIQKAIRDGIEAVRQAEELVTEVADEEREEQELRSLIAELEEEMLLAARNLQFERAAYFRDQIRELEQHYGKVLEKEEK